MCPFIRTSVTTLKFDDKIKSIFLNDYQTKLLMVFDIFVIFMKAKVYLCISMYIICIYMYVCMYILYINQKSIFLNDYQTKLVDCV